MQTVLQNLIDFMSMYAKTFELSKCDALSLDINSYTISYKQDLDKFIFSILLDLGYQIGARDKI